MISSSPKQNPWSRRPNNSDTLKKQKELLFAMRKKAHEILNDSKFVEYKSMYDQFYAQELENIMALDEQEPVKYAFKMRQIIDTLKAYRLLISAVEEDANRQMEESQ